MPEPLSLTTELIVTFWSPTVLVSLAVKTTRSLVPLASVPPAVSTPRTAAVPIRLSLLLLLLNKPPKARFKTSVAAVKAMSFCAPPERRNNPVVVVPVGSVVVVVPLPARTAILVIEVGLKPIATPFET